MTTKLTRMHFSALLLAVAASVASRPGYALDSCQYIFQTMPSNNDSGAGSLVTRALRAIGLRRSTSFDQPANTPANPGAPIAAPKPSLLSSLRPNSLSPRESGLTQMIAAIAKGRNHISQIPHYAETRESTLSSLESPDLTGENFQISKEDFDLFQAIRRTSFSSGSRQQFISDVNQSMPSPIDAQFKGEGAHIDNAFVDRLAKMKERIAGIADKLDRLSANRIEFYSYGTLWYADSSRFGTDGIRAFAEMDRVYREGLKRPFGLGPRDPSDADLTVASHYLQAYSDGEAPDLGAVSSALSLFADRQKINPQRGSLEAVLPPVAARAISEMSASGDRLAHAQKSFGWAFFEAFASNVAIADVMEIMTAGIEAGKANQVVGSFDSYFLSGDDKPTAHQFLGELLAKISSAAISRQSAANYQETIFLVYVASRVKMARYFDRWLGRGAGFHNAVRVRTVMEDAALGTEAFASLGLYKQVEMTAHLDLEGLARIFRGLKYDNLGRRPIGEHITPHQAFNLGGATRPEGHDVYSLIGEFILQPFGSRSDVPLGWRLLVETIEMPQVLP